MFDNLNEITSNIPSCSVEPGIQKLVGILNLKGIPTLLSCEGHAEFPEKNRAWVDLDPAHFKGYIKANSKRVKAFCIAGEGMWSLNIEIFGRSKFKGLGRPKPRLKKMKRIVVVDMNVRLSLIGPARSESGKKTRALLALVRAALRLL